MSYKTELQSNNVDLQGILDKVNALPEMEEAPELPTLSNPAAAAQILSGYEVLDQHGIKLTGIMEDNGAVSQTLNAGGSYTIPAGYHNGSGKVTGNSLASQTSANAAAADIASGKTAWVNGAKITGTLVPTQVVTGTVTTTDSTTLKIPNASSYNNIIAFWSHDDGSSMTITGRINCFAIIGSNEYIQAYLGSNYGIRVRVNLHCLSKSSTGVTSNDYVFMADRGHWRYYMWN